MFKIILAVIFIITILNTLDHNAPVLNEKLNISQQNAYIGAQIKNARLNKRYSQEYFARKAGMKRQQISNIENGNTQPTLEFIIMAEEILEVKISLEDSSPDVNT